MAREMMMAHGRRLLVNWLYAGALGHAIEAYKQALGFKEANPDLYVGVVVNGANGVELAQCLPQIDAVFPVDLSEFESSGGSRPFFQGISQDWDYLYTDYRARRPCGFSEAIDRFHTEFRAWIRPGLRAGEGLDTPPDFPQTKNTAMQFKLPDDNRRFARAFWSGAADSRISLLTGSSSFQKAPPLDFWRKVIRQLTTELGSVEFALIGVTGTTLHIAAADIVSLQQEFTNVRNAFDLGVLNQLAIIEQCGLHISPHSGMSFAVQCVGVPWLVISGTSVHEYLLNGVPFLCIYPECDRYPCSPATMFPECSEAMQHRRQPKCMQGATLEPRITELVESAKMLIGGQISYIECAKRHVAELNRRGMEGVAIWGDTDILTEQYLFPR